MLKLLHMNKLKYLLIVTILISAQLTFATSGACSSHEGVNCTAGPTSSGKVICNDGWAESRVGYEFTNICNNCSDLYAGYSKHLAINQIKQSIDSVTSLLERLQYANLQSNSYKTTFGAEALRQSIQRNYDTVIDNYCSMLKTAVTVQRKFDYYCKKNYSNNATFSLTPRAQEILKLYNFSIGLNGLSASPFVLSNNNFQINSYQNYECTCMPGYKFILNKCVKIQNQIK